LFFYAGDGEEPAHVHVERDADVAKLWMVPVGLARSGVESLIAGRPSAESPRSLQRWLAGRKT
jgi:hypothetical protein